jgi:hypothetical protein
VAPCGSVARDIADHAAMVAKSSPQVKPPRLGPTRFDARGAREFHERARYRRDAALTEHARDLEVDSARHPAPWSSPR